MSSVIGHTIGRLEGNASSRSAASVPIILATTGIAGPGGGTEEKPVGTVCIGLAWEGGRWSKRIDMGQRARDWIKMMTAQQALIRLHHHLLGRLEP